MRIRTTMRALTLGLALLAAPAAAQEGQAPGPERARLEQQVRERIGRMVQQHLQLDDAQLARLQQVNAKFEAQRRELVRRERATRLDLRREMTADAPEQKRVDTLLTELLAIQRQRLDVLAAEQRDLSTFLTPVQRARYLALQDQMRRRVEEMRRRSGPRRGPGGRGGPPPGERPF